MNQLLVILLLGIVQVLFFNLTIKGHSDCVAYVKQFGIPLLVTGGGGYTVRNVSRCWVKETAVLLDEELDNDLPYTDHFGYFGPDFKLNIQPSNMKNKNSPEYLQHIVQTVLENIEHAPNPPSGSMSFDAEDALFLDSDISESDVEIPHENSDENLSDQ